MGTRLQKPVEELTFADDGMFQAVLRDPAICAELVELLLGVQVDHVDYPALEKAIEPFYTTKGVRLDVYLKDKNKVIDVELQSYEQKALGKRMRYYEAMLDMDALMKGEDYENLKESYIVFICKYDPFIDENKKPFGLPRYTFSNTCSENNLVNLDDKSLKVVYNSTAFEAEKDERIKALLRFVQTNEAGQDDFSNRLNALVEKMKENEKFRRDYAAMNLHDRDIRKAAKEEGLAEGAQQKAIENAKNMLADNLSPEKISQYSGLSLEQVQELAEALAAQPAAAQA